MDLYPVVISKFDGQTNEECENIKKISSQQSRGNL